MTLIHVPCIIVIGAGAEVFSTIVIGGGGVLVLEWLERQQLLATEAIMW
jgi:hypothetical protein